MGTLLDGRVAVVTGGASGIGRGVALRFAQEGAVILVLDLHREPREGGQPTDSLIASTGGRASFVECDVTKLAQVNMAFEAADEVGGVDILFNGAGIVVPREFLDVTEEDFDRLMGVNLKAVFFVAQCAARRMVQKRTGSIINVSSIYGLQGTAPASLYCTSKGGVRLLSHALAAELGPKGIRVNTIHPGIVKSAMTTIDSRVIGSDREAARVSMIPLGRYGTPEEIADAAVFLASDLSRFINGTSLVVDGGQLRI
jgi:NAD(P)-dependent dehydrogenase (short-subunit alcohol dehydrogenase family)